MVMVVVIPTEEALAETAGIFNRTKELGELRLVLEGFEVGFRIRIVIFAPVVSSSGLESLGWRNGLRRSLTWACSAKRRYIVRIEQRNVPSSSKVAYTSWGDWSTKRSLCNSSNICCRSSLLKARTGFGCGLGSCLDFCLR